MDILMADKYEVEKFGDDYKSYIKKFTITNFLLGFIRVLRHNKQG